MRATKVRFCSWCAAELISRREQGVERLICPALGCGYICYDNPTPVVAALIERGDEVILVRSQGWPQGWYGLVTGFLERGESPRQGLLREIEEELGCRDVEVVGLIGNYLFEPMNQVILAYHVRITGELTLGEELAGYKAIPVAKLRPWALGTGEAVRDWLAARGGAAS